MVATTKQGTPDRVKPDEVRASVESLLKTLQPACECIEDYCRAQQVIEMVGENKVGEFKR